MASGSNGTVQVEEATAAGGSGHGAPQTTPGSGPQTARGTASKYDFVKVYLFFPSATFPINS